MKRLFRIIMPAAAVAAAVALALAAPRPAHGQQTAPQWINEITRNNRYPQSEWYVGFSQDAVRPGAGHAEALRRVEADARNKMAENITVNLVSASRLETTSARSSAHRAEAAGSQARSGTQSRETINVRYGQIIQTSTSAEVAGTETHSWFDEQNRRVYALAAVKRSALAAYYAAQIEAGLTEAQRNLDLGKQAMSLGRSGEAQAKFAESRARAESLARYADLLSAVAPGNAANLTQSRRVSDLLLELADLGSQNEAASLVYVTGRGTIMRQPSDAVTRGLYAMLSENNVGTTENESEAGYVINLEAEICDAKTEHGFHFANACVQVVLTNRQNGRNEVSTSVRGSKQAGTTPHEAAEKAFSVVVPEIWARVRGKIAAN